MDNFITRIKIKNVLHLQDFTIPISDTEKKHLIITGKNGTGKTVLLNAMEQYFSRGMGLINGFSLEPVFNDVNLHSAFVIAYYTDKRFPIFVEPKSPTKPNLTYNYNDDIRRTKVDQFLYFMVDCKTQEAFAYAARKATDMDHIQKWFDDFQDVLRQLFDDSALELDFDYKDYSFHIKTQGKSFKFTELSAGYAAALDIVTDLILKMQAQDNIVRAYDMPGIVLIDEIETHLHLELQRVILPMLTKLFPRIQFIVTTHSPFVLNSLENAVAFDLERREPITDLTDYSYEALAEGYFGVPSESSDIQLRLRRMKELIELKELSVLEQDDLNRLIKDFDKIPEVFAPNVKAQYYELKRKWNGKAIKIS